MEERIPNWIRNRVSFNDNYHAVQNTMRTNTLHTVCEEANCPNLFECWANKTATFMILGNICTRACRFCAVATGLPSELDLEEPKRVAQAASAMGLRHVVVTSVARDDLKDGGASIFALTIQELRVRNPQCTVEVLIPDFQGNPDALWIVLDQKPDILNHNIETVRRLSPKVRSGAKYERTLELLDRAKRMHPDIPTKSSIMIGVGETDEEINQTMRDLRDVNCNIMTIGQYLRPSKKHLTVKKYYPPEDFARLKKEALNLGFDHVESGPLVRSSYHAHEQPQIASKMR